MEIDLDAVVRQQDILENQAQKDRAALSQSKGLQTRRLPKNYASKVPEDYAARRRAQSYSTSSLVRSSVSDETDSPLRGNTPDLSEEERKQRVLSKSGLSTGSHPLAALGNILKKRNSFKGKGSPKSPKKSATDSPRSTPKMKKKDSLEIPDSGSFSKGLFGSLRRSSKKKNKGDSSASATTSTNVSTEDLRTDTSSIASLPIAYSPRHQSPITTSTPVKPVNSQEGSISPPPPTVEAAASTNTSLQSTSYRSPVREGPRDSALFREASIERLFDSDSSNLFGSSELDAFFKKEKEKSPERSIPKSKPTPVDAKIEETEPKKNLRQSESMSKMFSRLQAYEKASTSESISESPPLEEEGSKEEEEKKISKEGKDTEKVVKDEKKSKSSGLFDAEDDEDDLFAPPKAPSSPAKTTSHSDSKKKSSLFDDDEVTKTTSHSDSKKKSSLLDDEVTKTTSHSDSKKKSSLFDDDEVTKTTSQSDSDKKKASLFEDELFQEKPKPAVKKPPPKVSKKPKRSVDDTQKREPLEVSTKIAAVKEPATTATKLETSNDKPKAKESVSESKSPPPAVEDSVPKEEDKPVVVDTPKEEQPKEEDKPAKEEDKPAEKKPETISFFDDGSELPVYGLRRKQRTSQVESERVTRTEEKPVVKKTSKGLLDDDDEESELPPFGLRRKRRGVDKKETDEPPEPAKKIGGLFDDDHDEDLPPHYGRRRASKRTDEVDSGDSSLFGEVEEASKESTSQAESKDTETSDSALESKTKIELESEEREREKKNKPEKSSNLFDDDTADDKVVDATEDDTSKSPELQVRSPTPEEPADIKEETPPTEVKVKEEKKREPKRSAGTRDRSATELGTSSTGRSVGRTSSDQKDGKKEPSWMADLKKKRGEGEKSSVSPSTRKAARTSATNKDDEDLPDWQKRVLERRKNRAAAQGDKTAGSASPRTGSRLSTKTETSTSKSAGKSPSTDRKSTTSGQKSTVGGRKSPLVGRKSPNTERKLTDKATTERKSRFARDKDEQGLSKSTEVTSTRRIASKDKETPPSKDEKPKEETDSPTLSKNSEETKSKVDADSGSTKPKPKLSKKPSAEVVSKKITISTSRSSCSSTLSPEPAVTKSPKPEEPEEDDVFMEGKEPAPAKEKTPSPKLSVDLISSVLVEKTSATPSPVEEPAKESSEPSKESSETSKKSTEPSKDSIKPPKEGTKPSMESNEPDDDDTKPSKHTTASRSESTSSEQARSDTPPFRSHSISRSPTPTSPTGPLKISTDSGVPEWKKKLLEKKKSGGSSSPATKRGAGSATTSKKEPELPAWKKELLARKQGRTSPERKPRSATVSVIGKSSPSTSRAGRRGKVEETPDFMKEFKRKQRTKE